MPGRDHHRWNHLTGSEEITTSKSPEVVIREGSLRSFYGVGMNPRPSRDLHHGFTEVGTGYRETKRTRPDRLHGTQVNTLPVSPWSPTSLLYRQKEVLMVSKEAKHLYPPVPLCKRSVISPGSLRGSLPTLDLNSRRTRLRDIYFKLSVTNRFPFISSDFPGDSSFSTTGERH